MASPTNLTEYPRWKERFRSPIILSFQIASRNPRIGLAAGNFGGSLFQLYTWDVASGDLTALTDYPSGVGEGWLDPHGRHAYFLRDEGGSEMGHLTRVPCAGGPAEDVTPDFPAYTLRGLGFSGNGQLLAFNPVDREGFHLVVAQLDKDGKVSAPRHIFHSTHEAWYALPSYDGDLAALISTARAGGQRRYSTIVIDVQSGEIAAELWDGPEASVEAVRFSPLPGDVRLLATTSRSGFVRPLLWHPFTSQRRDINPPGLTGDLIPLDWSPDGNRLLLCQIDQAQQQLYTFTLESDALRRLDHAPGSYYAPYTSATCFAPDGQIMAYWQDAAHPPQVVALDPENGVTLRPVLSTGAAPAGRPWRSVSFLSSDGTQVQAWLATPEGAGPHPTILDVHGGPHFATFNQYSPDSQAWLDHGFAYCTVNYRGSTTFGRAFKEQIWGDVGHWEVEDILAARRWLVEQRIAQPEAILLTGASYGGFLTLLTLGKHPDLWAGGIALVAVADTEADYELANPALQAAIAGWYGGTPAEKPDLYRVSSPMTYANAVAAPLLVIQGRNDTRVPPQPMERYAELMRSLGKPFTIEWFDAGHGALDSETMIGFQEKMIQFVLDVIGGSEQ